MVAPPCGVGNSATVAVGGNDLGWAVISGGGPELGNGCILSMVGLHMPKIGFPINKLPKIG